MWSSNNIENGRLITKGALPITSAMEPPSSDYTSCIVSEIEEENELEELPNPRSRVLATVDESGEDVYVAVGKRSSSMAALVWALKQIMAARSSSITFVYLVHVFPETRWIPTPLGKLPKSQARPEQVECYLNQEQNKRLAMLQKFLNLCSASKVNADTILVESDLVAKSILDLIPIMGIRRLVVGTTQSNMRKLTEGNGIAEKIHKNAPSYCNVRIICEDKEVSAAPINQIVPPSSLNFVTAEEDYSCSLEGEENKGSFSCICFSSKLT